MNGAASTASRRDASPGDEGDTSRLQERDASPRYRPDASPAAEPDASLVPGRDAPPVRLVRPSRTCCDRLERVELYRRPTEPAVIVCVMICPVHGLGGRRRRPPPRRRPPRPRGGLRAFKRGE